MSLQDCFNKILASQSKTPQEQRDVIQDIKRRGFLKQVINATIFGLGMSACAHKSIADTIIEDLPDLGDSDRTNLSPQQADLLGKQVVLNIYAQGGMVEDFDCLDYLNKLGNEFVSYSPMAGKDFNFYLVKDKDINAFALPGGYICANNGLLYTTLSEAELSGVLAHEVGHVVQHHIFRNISVHSRAQWTSIAGLIAGVILAPINPGIAMVAAQSGSALGTQNMLSFSRDYEREADRVGQNLMYKAGFDAHAMPGFFQRMQDRYKFNTNDAYAFLQSHPVTLERLSEAETRANQLPVKMRPDSLDFLLAREKCRIRQLDYKDSLKFYNSAIAAKRYVSLEAQLYGLSLTHFLQKDYTESIQTLDKIKSRVYQSNPMVAGLKAKQLIVSGNNVQADKLYDQLLDTYPTHKGLWMGQLEFLIANRGYAKAAVRLDELGRAFPFDPDVWDQYAILYADNRYNNPIRYHYGLGSEYIVLGNYKHGLEQYKTALKKKPTNKEDDKIQSIISARIPEIMRAMSS